jgi:hypothetical protein
MDWIVLSLTLLAAGMPGDKGLDAIGLARETLARELGVEAGAFAVQKVEAVEWRDSSLGCPEKGMMYAQVIVPGYRVVLEHGGRAHHVHIGGGRAIRCESSSRRGTVSGDKAVAAARAARLAREDLARRLGVPTAAVKIRRVKWATWPDASLGCPAPNTTYAQVETEGLLVELEVAGRTHEYHTAGERVVPCHGSNF